MLIGLVPEEKRATVFTVRNFISSISSIACVFIGGQWLSHRPFPGNYQILFAVSGALCFLSLFAWLSMRYPPEEEPSSDAGKKKVSLIEQVKEFQLIYKSSPVFTRYVINYILLNIGLWMVGPIYTLYTVRQLNASDAWIGNSGTIAGICSMVGLYIGKRVVEKWGEVDTQRRLVLLVGLYPIIYGLTHSLTAIMIFQSVYSLLAPSYDLGNTNLFLKILPTDRREDAIATYNTIMSIGPFIFPLVGTTLSGFLGIGPTLIGCGVVTLLGSLSFWIWRIKIK
jgi:Na+/melibiose symporter-like transporter